MVVVVPLKLVQSSFVVNERKMNKFFHFRCFEQTLLKKLTREVGMQKIEIIITYILMDDRRRDRQTDRRTVVGMKLLYNIYHV